CRSGFPGTYGPSARMCAGTISSYFIACPSACGTASWVRRPGHAAAYDPRELPILALRRIAWRPYPRIPVTVVPPVPERLLRGADGSPCADRRAFCRNHRCAPDDLHRGTDD